jgi:hypothetical protein
MRIKKVIGAVGFLLRGAAEPVLFGRADISV